MSDPLELRPTATRPEVEARRADRRRKAAELADRVIASVAVDGLAAMQELDHLRGEHEARRVELVAALHLPPETVWADALARVARVVPVAAGAKGCHGCRFAHGLTCAAGFAASLSRWQDDHLSDDLLTPKPGAPECPGRVSREQG